MDRDWRLSGFVLSVFVLVIAQACVGSSEQTPSVPPSPSVEGASSATPHPTRSAPMSPPTEIARATRVPASTIVPKPIEPTAVPEPLAGYWIQTTTKEGLCGNSPRFIGFNFSQYRPYIGGDGSSMCYFARYALERWPSEYPSPTFGFPSWNSIDLPGLSHVSGGTAFSPYASANPNVPYFPGAYGMPSFAGSGGRCVLDNVGEWLCFSKADGLPFDDVRGYGIVQKSNVEWFMSSDSVASYGMQPEDQVYSIPELVGDPAARPTWLHVPHAERMGIWVATNGYGVLRIDPLSQQVTRFTAIDGLPADDVRDVVACGDRCAWVATVGGVGYWDGEQWRAYTTRDGLPSDKVYGISFDEYEFSRGNVWAATAAGPAVLVVGKDGWQSFPDFPSGVRLTGVMGTWFSTAGHGLFRFIEGTVARGDVTLFTATDGLPGERITALAMLPDGVLAGTPQGGFEWDGLIWTCVIDTPVNDASSTMAATDGGLWVRQDAAWEKANDERVILVADDGWYATPDQVCQWVDGTSHCPATSDGQSVANVQILYVIPGRGDVIVIDAEGRFLTYDTAACDTGCFKEEFSLSAGRLGPSISRVDDLLVSPTEWLFATHYGVFRAQDERGRPGLALDEFALSGDWPVAVRRMSLDESTGMIWIATNQGAFYQTSPESRWTRVMGLPDQDLTAMAVFPGSGVWFGTAGGSVIYFEMETADGGGK